MKLNYRGVQYQKENQSASIPLLETRKEIIYRGNSPKATINPHFPCLRYIKQLFRKSESKPVIDPIRFWYDHKREFLEDCWFSDDLEKLNHALNLTLQIEIAKALKAKHKTKLKYRGVTYYR